MPIDDGSKSKLSLHSSNFDKSNERINILLKKFKNLVTQKVEGITLYAKIEYNELQIAESPKIQITPDSVPDINFNCHLNLNVTDSTSLDDISFKPIIITFVEVLPKEKKQKDEKVQTFGQCTFSLFEVLKGKFEFSLKLPVFPTPGSSLETQTNDAALPELEVKVSTTDPVLSDEDSNKSNLLTITLESMYAIPESWNNSTRELAYSVSIPVPVNDDKDTAIVFANGLQKAATDPPGKQKRWADTRGIQAINALYIPNSNIEEDANSEEIDDFSSKEDKEYRVLSEKEKPRISWNIERHCYLSQASNAALRDQILKTRYWPIELIRSSVPTGVKGKRDDDMAISYHGVVYLDMQPLLYPGATQIKGAFKIYPFVENEYQNKTKRKAGILDETLKILNVLYDRNYAVSPNSKKDPKIVDKKDTKKGKESNIDPHEMSQSVQQIIDSKSYIVIDIKFDKPLIPRKPFEFLVKRVSELIPIRQKYPLRSNSAEKAVQDYHAQIKSILNSVLDDYRNIVTDENEFISSIDVENAKRETDYENKRKKLLYELNSTGKYFAFKEQLKNSVIKIVREKFLKTSALNDPDELQQFLSELYVFLIDELHKALNNTLTIEDVPSVDNNLTDNEQMRHFAFEAELNRNYDLAAYYYQERIAREKDNFNNWLDYAVFNLQIDDYARCEECLKECISINPNDINSLLLYSIICSIQDKHDTAEIFLERVAAQEPENLVAWTLYSILYEQKGLELNAELTLKKVIKLNQTLLAETQNHLIQQNQLLNDNGAEEEMVSVKKEDGLLDDDTLKPEQAKSRTSLGKRSTAPLKSKPDIMSSKSPKSPGVLIKNEESVLSLKDKQLSAENTINKSVFLRSASFLIKYNAFAWAEKLLAKELLSATGGPSCQYHVMLTKIKVAKKSTRRS